MSARAFPGPETLRQVIAVGWKQCARDRSATPPAEPIMSLVHCPLNCSGTSCACAGVRPRRMWDVSAPKRRRAPVPAHPRICPKDSSDRSVLLERSVETPWIAVEIGKRQIDSLDRYLTHPHLCRRIRRTTLLHTTEFLIYMRGCGTPGGGNLQPDCGRGRGEVVLSLVSERRIYR
jgi:hypothetical protein